MISQFIKVVVVFISFFSEIHVAAKTSAESVEKKPQGLEFPQGCLSKKQLPCALKSTAKVWSFELDSVKVVLKKNSTVIWKDKGKYQPVAGEIWFFGSQPQDVEVYSEFGYFQSVKESLNVFVKKSPELMEIYPLTEGVIVFPLSSKEQLGHLLPVGYRSFLASVGKNGVAQYEIPVAANLKGLIRDWAPMFDGTPQELSDFLSSYRTRWVQAVEDGASLHNTMVERELASEKRRQVQRAQELRLKKEEERYLKKLFRQKNYLDE